MTREQLRQRLELVLIELAHAEDVLDRERLRSQPVHVEPPTLYELRLPDGSWPFHAILTARATALAALVAVSS